MHSISNPGLRCTLCLCVIILSSDTKQCVIFSQCTAPVFEFQNADFPINENQDAQVCVEIDPFEPQTAGELTIEFIVIDGTKAGMY